MASTSAFEIGFAAVELADVPAGAEGAAAVDGEGAEAPFAPADGDGDEGLAAAVTLAACLEPKMADTMLPKTLILSSYFCSCTQDRARLPAAPEEGFALAREILRGRERLVWAVDRESSISTLI